MQKTMVLYPVTYLITTLPLAGVCIYVQVNGPVVPLEVVCMAGVLVASAGWMNCILYSLTRGVSSTAKTTSPS